MLSSLLDAQRSWSAIAGSPLQELPRKLKYRHKHPPKIHIWGGISMEERSHLLCDATKYGDDPADIQIQTNR